MTQVKKKHGTTQNAKSSTTLQVISPLDLFQLSKKMLSFSMNQGNKFTELNNVHQLIFFFHFSHFISFPLGPLEAPIKSHCGFQQPPSKYVHIICNVIKLKFMTLIQESVASNKVLYILQQGADLPSDWVSSHLFPLEQHCFSQERQALHVQGNECYKLINVTF